MQAERSEDVDMTDPNTGMLPAFQETFFFTL
jgi:hypothetical protein